MHKVDSRLIEERPSQSVVDTVYGKPVESTSPQNGSKVITNRKVNPLTATQPCPLGTYRLVYLNMRGRAELIRLLFKAADVDFQDERVEHEDWPELKSHTPTGVVPYLVTPDGEVMVQSMAIARYLAHKFQFYATCEVEVYKIERAIAQLQDLGEEAYKVIMAGPNTREAAFESFKNGAGKNFLTILEAYLQENTDHTGLDQCYFSGKRTSIADLFSVAMCDWLLFNFQDILKPFPLILKNYNCCLVQYPSIKSYLTTGPKSFV